MRPSTRRAEGQLDACPRKSDTLSPASQSEPKVGPELLVHDQRSISQFVEQMQAGKGRESGRKMPVAAPRGV
jgi:hypothetical protein